MQIIINLKNKIKENTKTNIKMLCVFRRTKVIQKSDKIPLRRHRKRQTMRVTIKCATQIFFMWERREMPPLRVNRYE